MFCFWLVCLVIFFDFGAFGGSRIPRPAVGASKTHPPRTLQDALIFSSFLGCLFGSIFNRSWLGFPPQFASQNPPKSMKNRCQEALYVGLQICIDFFKFLLPTWTPGSLKIIVFLLEKYCVFEKLPLEVNSDFGSILEANMPPKSTQNPSKSGTYRLSRSI